MAKYLLQVSYTAQGAQGLMKEGGSGRRAMVDALTAGLGGSVDAFYFTFGQSDVVLIVDVPDNVTVAAVSLTVSASGAASCSITVLLTLEEIDEATKVSVAYRAPKT